MSESRNHFDSAEALVHEYVRTKKADLRDSIVKRYSGLVERVAKRYAGLEPHEDLVQVGFMGLLNALSLFEPSRGVRFNTYATHLVAGSIKHHLRDRGKIIREPAWLQEVRHKVNRIFAQLQQDLGRVPTDHEVAQRAELSAELVREVMSTEDLFRVASLTTALSPDDEEGEEIDLIDECAYQLSMEERLVLEGAIGELRELEQQVLYLFHFEALNQTEIAARLNISGNYVSHILRQSVSKLRAVLNAEEKNDRVLRRQAKKLRHDVMDETMESYSEGYLIARLDEECARASCDDSCVGFVRVQFEGLDSLGRFYGADAVDDFLRDAAAFLRDGVRRLDIVGRMGETGFGVVLPGAGERVNAVFHRLVDRLRGWLAQDTVARAGVTLLMGAAFYPKSGRSAKKILAAAHLHPLEAKKAA